MPVPDASDPPKGPPPKSSPATMYPGSTAPTMPSTPAADQVYAFSPRRLSAKGCACMRPRRELASAPAVFEYMHRRLAKAFHRLSPGAPVHRAIKDAFTRVLVELRDRGEELFHLVASEGHSDRARREVSIVLLVPDMREACKHLVLAEILVHFGAGNRHSAVENVAVRYAEDWSDWTVTKTIDYFTDPDDSEPRRVTLAQEKPVSGLGGVDEIWQAIVQVGGQTCAASREQFQYTWTRVVERIEGEGGVLAIAEVQRWYRGLSRSGTVVQPVGRIGLLVAAAVDSALSEEWDLTGPDGDPQGFATAAVIVIDFVPAVRRQHTIQHLSVMYRDEWPITHHYRQSIPRPDVRGLEDLVEG